MEGVVGDWIVMTGQTWQCRSAMWGMVYRGLAIALMDPGKQIDFISSVYMDDRPGIEAGTLHQWNRRARSGRNRTRAGAALDSAVSGWEILR